MEGIQISFSHKISRITEQHRFALRHQQQFNRLTPREKEVLKLLASGNSNPDIAAALHLSLYTVKNHRKHIKEKLEVHSLAEMIYYALAFDLI